MVTDGQLQQMARLKGELGMTGEQWKAVIAKRNGLDGKPLTTAKHLTFAQADELLGKLEQKRASKAASDGLNDWANRAVASNLASGQRPKPNGAATAQQAPATAKAPF